MCLCQWESEKGLDEGGEESETDLRGINEVERIGNRITTKATCARPVYILETRQ